MTYEFRCATVRDDSHTRVMGGTVASIYQHKHQLINPSAHKNES